MVTQIGELLKRNQPAQASSGDVWKHIARAVEGMDFETYVKLITDLWEAMGRKDPPGDTLLKMWYITMRNITAEQLGRAILVYLETAADQYCTPKLLIELSGAKQTDDHAAIVGWNEVVSEISRVGAYQSPVFSDPRTSATVKHLGGWILICDTKPDELHKWTRQNFLKTFSALHNKHHEKLHNLIDSENARTGQIAAAAAVRLRIDSRHSNKLETEQMDR